jgi:predicted nucleotidyltransferase
LRKINFDLIRPIVLKTLQNVDGIFLHGSYARGDYSDESDLDLIIVTNSHCRTSYIKAKLEGEL